MKNKVHIATIAICVMAMTIGIASAATEWSDNNTFTGTVNWFQNGIRIGQQGTGGVTFFNGTIVNETTDDSGDDNPVTFGDNVRIDGELFREAAGGDKPLKVSDTVIPTKSNTYSLGSSSKRFQDGNFSGTMRFGALEAPNVISSGHIQDGEVSTLDLADNSITSSKIAEEAVSAPEIASGAVTSAKISENSIDFINIANSPDLDSDLKIEGSTLFIGNTGGSYAGRVGVGTVFPTNTFQVADYINFDNTSDLHLTALGYQAGKALQAAGTNNTFIGYQAGDTTTTGARNTAVGNSALTANTTGSDNTAVGNNALVANVGTGQRNVAIGNNSLDANTNGVYNVALGYGALGGNIGGSYNIGVGYLAGDNITSGSSNLIIGAEKDAASATGSNQLNIGDAITGDLSTGIVTFNESKTVTNDTDGKTLTINESGSVQTNASAVGAGIWNLPEASTVIGSFYIFVVATAQNLDVNPADASDRILGLTDAAGDAVRGSTVGETLTLLAIDSTNWVVISSYGTWADVN